MGFSILACAALTLHDPRPRAARAGRADDPAGGGTYVLSIIGGIGGSITMLSYNYWMREEKIAGPEWLGSCAATSAIAYVFTAIFGMSIMLIANQAFHVAGRHHHRRAGGDEDGRDARRDDRAVRRLRVFAWILGGGLRVAARRLAERAVSLRRLLRHDARSCRPPRASG